MKVIFLKDVPKIGRKGDVKEVADGFAYNSLIPRKLVQLATPENLRRAEDAKASVSHARETKESQLRDITKRSEETPVHIAVEANAKGSLFKGLRASEIAEVISKTLGISIDEHDVVLALPLKEVGTHRIALRAGQAKGECVIIIEAKKK